MDYSYDFGDGWVHEIQLEKILPREKDTSYPLCIDGKRACPPEDCGGVWGYPYADQLLKMLSRWLPDDGVARQDAKRVRKVDRASICG